MPVPEDNQLTVDKIELGRRLFHDRRLSRDRSLSCASCHDPRRAFSSTQPQAIGVFGRRGLRNAPALINRGYGRAFFWDGRIPTLERQVLRPIEDENEMDLTLAEASARVGLDAETISQALASYVRSILSGDSPFDRYLFGDPDALSAPARRGLSIFRGKGNCTLCHVGPNLTDEEFHNTGVAWKRPQPLPSAASEGSSERRQTPGGAREGGVLVDLGRFLVTGEESDRGAFKTPTLREVARTAPYMHDGSLRRLEDVVQFYNEGGRSNPYLDPEIHPLGLREDEARALVAFLGSLSGTIREGAQRP